MLRVTAKSLPMLLHRYHICTKYMGVRRLHFISFVIHICNFSTEFTLILGPFRSHFFSLFICFSYPACYLKSSPHFFRHCFLTSQESLLEPLHQDQSCQSKVTNLSFDTGALRFDSGMIQNCRRSLDNKSAISWQVGRGGEGHL